MSVSVSECDCVSVRVRVSESLILNISLLSFSSFYNFRCRNKYLEFQRSNVIASDYQRIKVQELDSIEESARVPRTFDVEVLGEITWFNLISLYFPFCPHINLIPVLIC